MINILLVDDHVIVREGIRRIIDDTSGMEVIAEAGNGQDALNYVWKNKYDLIILDISMPGKNGLETLKEIKSHDRDLPVLMLSMHAENQYAMRTLKAGAAGYLTKDTAGSQLVKAIRKVIKGKKYISPEVAELLAVDIFHEGDKELHEYLSDREFQVMVLVASGKSIVEISKELSLSDKTISTYRTRILTKMGMHSNAEIIYYSINHKLIN